MINSWDEYAQTWEDRKKNKSIIIQEQNKQCDELEVVGDEWGDTKSVNEICKDFIFPFIDKNSIVLEIGSGAGRISKKIADKCKLLHCADVSTAMIEKARRVCQGYNNVIFTPIDGRNLQKFYLDIQFDFIFSFDVLVHLRVESIVRYLEEMRSMVKKNGKIFIHTTNIKTKYGYELFVRQIKNNNDNVFGSLRFVSADVISFLVQKLGYTIIKQSTEDESNYYYRRDALFVLAP